MKPIKGLWQDILGLGKKSKQGLSLMLIVCLLLLMFFSVVNNRISLLNKKRSLRQKELSEMLVLKQRYQEAGIKAQKLANRLSTLRPEDSPGRIVEELGIKGKGSQIKLLKGEEREGYIEDAAEVRLDGLSANEALNLIYGLEKGSKPVIIKKALLKTRFDDPARFDLTLILTLLKPAPAGPKR
jgi:general secretion pathway protein M